MLRAAVARGVYGGARLRHPPTRRVRGCNGGGGGKVPKLIGLALTSPGGGLWSTTAQVGSAGRY